MVVCGVSSLKLGNDGIDHNNMKADLFQESVKEMLLLLRLVRDREENIMFTVCDLDVTVSVGLLLGKGYTIEETLEQLKGQTLESVVISTRIACAVKALAKLGKASEEDFPLLMHVNELLNEGETLNIPCKKFQRVMG